MNSIGTAQVSDTRPTKSSGRATGADSNSLAGYLKFLAFIVTYRLILISILYPFIEPLILLPEHVQDIFFC